MKSWLVPVITVLPVLTRASALTWPSPYDEFEDIMFLQSGYARRGLFDGITPCSGNPGGDPDSQASASWVRTLFHDMITANVSAGTGGVDASLIYEMDRPENKGARVFNETYGFLISQFSRKVSMADLTALGVYATVAFCGGPTLQVRAGRVDATGPGPSGVPEPTDATQKMVARYATAGFNVTEMVASVACGHTLGAVRGRDFPEITGGRQNTTDNFGFDSTQANFDNQVVTEYLHGNTSNLLVVGPEATNSDKRVFLADSNITMNLLKDPATFNSMCAHVFERMMDTVPASVKLTDPITPYPVKPTQAKLGLTANGNTTFSGSIRVALKDRDISEIDSWVVTMPYADRKGKKHTIQTKAARFQGGSGTGFDGQSFKFFEFDASIPASSSISKFNVTLKTSANSSKVESFDNNHSGGFPLQDSVIVLQPQSCIGDDDFQGDSNKRNMTIVAAVRNERANKPVRFEVVIKNSRQGFIVPKLSTDVVTMKKWTGVAHTAGYTLFKATYGVPLGGLSSTFDVISGKGKDEIRDEFRHTGELTGTTCQPWA